MTNSITSLNPLDYASVALCCTFTQNLDNPYTVRITQCWQHVSVTSRTKCLYSLLDVGINSKPVQWKFQHDFILRKATTWTGGSSGFWMSWHFKYNWLLFSLPKLSLQHVAINDIVSMSLIATCCWCLPVCSTWRQLRAHHELLPCGLDFVLISHTGHLFCGCSLNSVLKHLNNLSAVTRSDKFKLHENLNVMTFDPSVGWEQLSIKGAQIFHMANKIGKIVANT